MKDQTGVLLDKWENKNIMWLMKEWPDPTIRGKQSGDAKAIKGKERTMRWG